MHKHLPAGAPRRPPLAWALRTPLQISIAPRAEAAMKRREFLKSMTAVAAGSLFPAPAVWSPASAQGRQETLLVVTESGPNSLDIHTVGAIVPSYEVSWNCYDRLITHAMKAMPDGSD